MASPRVLVIHNEPVLPRDHPDSAAEFDVIEATEIVVGILREAGFTIRQLGFSHDPRVLLDELRDHPADVVFNMFEGLADRTETEISVVSFLEWLNIPFTGCPAFAIALGRDKFRTKHLLQGAGVPTPAFLVFDQMKTSPWPYAWPAIVKPAMQDCSVGIDQGSVVTNQKDLDDRVAYTLNRFGPPVIVEEFISGRELLANYIEEPTNDPRSPRLVRVPYTEIRYTATASQNIWPIYSYQAKWNDHSEEFLLSPYDTNVTLPSPLADAVADVAERAYKLLGLRDCGRVDLRLTPDGRPFVLEVNPNPYLHSEALIDGLKAIGRSHPKFIENMVWNALARGQTTAAPLSPI
ncbi:MAG: hypothetical protein K8T89_25540 [Planctomycetes bacterium]|nr:hypothetical protein [Planctomycetota bacterium]